jgi:hypothetical protein
MGVLYSMSLDIEVLILVNESSLIASLGSRSYFKIDSLVFLPLSPLNPKNDKAIKFLDSFSKLLTSFGYFSLGDNCTNQFFDNCTMNLTKPKLAGQEPILLRIAARTVAGRSSA